NPLHSVAMWAQIARLEPKQGDLARLRKDAAALRASGKLTEGERLLVDALEGQVVLDHDELEGAGQLQRVIAAAEKLPGDVDASKARGYAHVALQLDAARRGRWADAMALLAAEAALPRPSRCAVGLFIDDARAGIAVLSATGQARGVYDGARKMPMFRWEP